MHKEVIVVKSIGKIKLNLPDISRTIIDIEKLLFIEAINAPVPAKAKILGGSEKEYMLCNKSPYNLPKTDPVTKPGVNVPKGIAAVVTQTSTNNRAKKR